MKDFYPLFVSSNKNMFLILKEYVINNDILDENKYLQNFAAKKTLLLYLL